MESDSTVCMCSHQLILLCFCVIICLFLGQIHRGGIAGLFGKYIYLEKLLGCFPKRRCHFTFLLEMFEFSSFFTCSSIQCVVSLLDPSTVLQWCLIVVLTCISVMIDNVEHLFMCSLASHLCIFGEMSVQIFHLFFNWFVLRVEEVFNFLFLSFFLIF